MCGLGFLGALVVLFYIFVFLALLSFLSCHLASKALRWMRKALPGGSSSTDSKPGDIKGLR